MFKILQIALRNLARYKRRSFLTGLLIALGVAAVMIFGSLSGSFKQLMIGEITDSMLGHVQVHRKGYVASIENLPLDRNMPPRAYERLTGILDKNMDIAAYSPRLKLGAMLSNYETSTSIRLNGVEPEKEAVVVPALVNRILDGKPDGVFLQRGEILIPELLAKGMQIKTGDTVVLIANNKDGSVNGINVKVAGVVAGVTGPGGRDGYMHLQDAADLLRMTVPEISEVALRLKGFDRLKEAAGRLEEQLQALKSQQGQAMFEIHTWDQLSPFANIANLIDLMSLFIKAILVAVVLISILNIMMMSVYERVREIGTIAAIGTPPAKILYLFLTEGLALGLIGSMTGAAIGSVVIWMLSLSGLEVTFGRGVVHLAPAVQFGQIGLAGLIVLVISALASLQPAAKASRLEPVEALRHV
ncbi:MAG: ABC transporter permease [Thermodesulfobacteriota bacterium]